MTTTHGVAGLKLAMGLVGLRGGTVRAPLLPAAARPARRDPPAARTRSKPRSSRRVAGSNGPVGSAAVAAGATIVSARGRSETSIALGVGLRDRRRGGPRAGASAVTVARVTREPPVAGDALEAARGRGAAPRPAGASSGPSSRTTSSSRPSSSLPAGVDDGARAVLRAVRERQHERPRPRAAPRPPRSRAGAPGSATHLAQAQAHVAEEPAPPAARGRCRGRRGSRRRRSRRPATFRNGRPFSRPTSIAAPHARLERVERAAPGRSGMRRARASPLPEPTGHDAERGARARSARARPRWPCRRRPTDEHELRARRRGRRARARSRGRAPR